MTEQTVQAVPPEIEPARKRVAGPVRWLIVAFGAIGILFHINQIFNLQFFSDTLIIDTAYFYILVALFLSLVFLIYPAHKSSTTRIPLYDWALFALAFGSALYMAWHGEQMVLEGWDLIAPTTPTVLAAAICFLALEAIRRVGGTVLFFILSLIHISEPTRPY